MESEKEAWIAIVVGGLVGIADGFFGFLSKSFSFVLLGVIIFGFLFLTIKSAIREALREHHFDK